MEVEEVVEISFQTYENLLLENYNNSSLIKSYHFCENLGLLLSETDYEDADNPTLTFKVVDKEKWFLSKIKFGI